MRAIKYLELELTRPITVLIGENGAGKSTILECLELLRKAAEPNFMTQFYAQHRGMAGLLRKGENFLMLGVTIKDDEGALPPVFYDFALRLLSGGTHVAGETLAVLAVDHARAPLAVLERSFGTGEVFDERAHGRVAIPSNAIKHDQLLISSFGNLPPHPAITRVLNALRGIEVHLPFDTTASWAARAYQLTRSGRSSTMLLPAERLDLLGYNLANAWSELKNGPSALWEEALGLVRLGLGEHIDSVVLRADPGGGQVALALTVTGLNEPILATDLSDGQLTWLAFIALTRLNQGRSLLAIDEPELHLHPALLGRVMSMLTNLPGGAPVVVCTHSDRVLELLDDPAAAVRVCSLSSGRAEVSRLDAETLPRWLEQFGDLGQLRAAGYLPRVVAPPPPAKADDEPVG
ncbi:ATP-binding protein [Myxococcota bacterium]|nr:ATP-binding protein [Myxococcota bacterium]